MAIMVSSGLIKGSREHLTKSFDTLLNQVGGKTPPGLIVQVTLLRPEGMEVMNVWESVEAEKAAHRDPAVTERRTAAGFPADIVKQPPVEVYMVRMPKD